MVLKLLILLLLHHTIFGQKYHYGCSEKSALLLLKRPVYDFSTRILERVAEDKDGHFVFSPISTWLQLTTIAEGANGLTHREIWKVTGHHKNKCFKRKLRRLLKGIHTDLGRESQSSSILIIDKLMDVKRSFIQQTQRLYGIKTMLLDFNYPETSAEIANRVIERHTGGEITEAVYGSDFRSSVLLMSDNMYFKSAWRQPFNPSYTTQEPFYSGVTSKAVVLGDVNMMNQIGYFNITELPTINAQILEMPCQDGRFSMLVFLPIKDIWISELFFMMKNTRLTVIYNMFKRGGVKLVDVRLPRFRIRTVVDNLPELEFDMGVKRIFNPNLAELKRISKFKIYVSLMTQIADIEVTEQGVEASESAHFLVSDDNVKLNFTANRPFGYMIVDRKTELILFAGAYSVPSVY